MVTSDEVESRLRHRVLRELHLGELGPGDRLPSIRAVAAELDADHRTVSKAYRRLELEGLVEVRPRAGVFVAEQERLGETDFMLSSTARWVTEILTEGWSRGIPVPELASVISRCTEAVEISCACVDDVIDTREVLVAEASQQFGLRALGVAVPDRNPVDEVRKELEGVDLVLTPAFHARIVEEASRGLELRTVVLSVNSESRARLAHAADAAPLTVVAVDPGYPDRLRGILNAGAEVRFVSVDEVDDLADLDIPGEVHVTLPARRRLGEVDHPDLIELAFALSSETAREITGIIVEENARRG